MSTFRIGFLPLVDAALPNLAHEQGFAAAQGIAIQPVRERTGRRPTPNGWSAVSARSSLLPRGETIEADDRARGTRRVAVIRDGRLAAGGSDGGGVTAFLASRQGICYPSQMSAVTFREATLADLPAIVALLAEDTLDEKREDPSLPLDPAYEAAFHTIAANPDQRQLVAERDGAVIGTMQLTFIPGIAFRGAWRGQIEAVRVAGALRGQGIGGEMIDWAVEQCRARGCWMVQLTSDKSRTAAHRFYERLGWARSHEGFKIKL